MNRNSFVHFINCITQSLFMLFWQFFFLYCSLRTSMGPLAVLMKISLKNSIQLYEEVKRMIIENIITNFRDESSGSFYIL